MDFHSGVLVVSLIAFYSIDSSSNSTEIKSTVFICKFRITKESVFGLYIFKNGPSPASLSFFGLFKKHYNFFNNICEKCPSSRHGRDISRGIISRQKSGRVEIEIGEASPIFQEIEIGIGEALVKSRVGGIGILFERSRDKSG